MMMNLLPFYLFLYSFYVTFFFFGGLLRLFNKVPQSVLLPSSFTYPTTAPCTAYTDAWTTFA